MNKVKELVEMFASLKRIKMCVIFVVKVWIESLITFHVWDRRQPSCSWHRTSAGSAQEQSRTCTAGCLWRWGEQIRTWRSGGGGREPCWQPTSGDQHWADQGNEGKWWLQTWSGRPNGSDLHRWEWWAWVCGSRCHTKLRCQCRRSRRCSQPTGGLRGWHCKAQQRCQRPWGKAQQSRCSWFGQGIPHGFWRWGGFPCLSQYHPPKSGSSGIPGGNRKIQILCERHRGRSRQARHLHKEKTLLVLHN